MQSAAKPTSQGGVATILDTVVTSASQRGGSDGDIADDCIPIARDLAGAWRRCCATTKRAIHLGLKSRNSRVDSLGDWLVATDGCVSNIAEMPMSTETTLATYGSGQGMQQLPINHNNSAMYSEITLNTEESATSLNP